MIDPFLFGKSHHQQQVELLMNKIPGQEIPLNPTVLSEKDRLLRAKLILEEALEIISALGIKVSYDLWGPRTEDTVIDAASTDWEFSIAGPQDVVKSVDGFCDLRVICTGGLSQMGIPDLRVQAAVDEANLTKFEAPKCPKCTTPMEFGDEGDLKDKWYCYCDRVTPTVILPKEAGPYRREDGKWVKPPYFVSPESTIKEILLGRGWTESQLENK